MVCFPIMVHTSVSCLLGLGYGCGYICSIASYEIAGKVKNRNKKKNENENENEKKEHENENKNEKKEQENEDRKNNEVRNELTVSELVSTLEAVKIELKEMKINLESIDNKVDKVDKVDKVIKKRRTSSF